MSSRIKNIFYIPFILGLLAGCSGLEDSEKERIRKMNATGEYVYRTHEEIFYVLEAPMRHIRKNYPWEETLIGNQVRINKEFFRCKGNTQNTPREHGSQGQISHTFDCGAVQQQHSLPYRESKEYVYPVLIDLLNYIQEMTKKKVVVTCGHRCPTHNIYADSSQFNRTSKHMIAAEVDFYVKGLEWRPEVVVEMIEKYYFEHPQYKEDSHFSEFHRYEKETNVSTLPWYNKEIFIKLFKKDEGRDFDNNHRFPYISIQVKWDREKEEPVTYNWAKAFNGYLRY